MDINFLSHNNKDKKREVNRNFLEDKDKKDAIEWTKAADIESASVLAGERDDLKNGKSKNSKPDLPADNRRTIENMKKLKKSRKEILELINQQQKNNSASDKKAIDKKEEKKKLKAEKRKGQRGLSRWFSKLLSGNDNKKNKETFSAKNSAGSREELLPVNKEKEEDKDRKNNSKIKNKKYTNSLKQTDSGEKWATPDILETNLIKDNAVVFFNWGKNIVFLIMTVIFSLAVVLGVYYWLIWREAQEIGKDYGFKGKLAQIDSQTEKMGKYIQDNRIEELKSKLNLASILLSSHVYWTNFFNYLEKNTLSDVYYLNFSGNTKGKYVLNSRTKKFSIIESQVKQFLSDEYTISAFVNRGAIDEGGSTKDNKDYSDINNVGYDINLVLDTSIFVDYK